MKKVDQTVFGIERGNCFSACIASLLELPIDRVPFFMTGDDWFDGFQAWLKPFGLYGVALGVTQTDAWRRLLPGHYVLCGLSPRGPHAVVARDLEMVHDPHPDRTGLLVVEEAILLVPFEPAHAVAGSLLMRGDPYGSGAAQEEAPHG